MGLIFPLACMLVGLLILGYLESPNYGKDRMINRLVKESRKREKRPKANRAFRYAQVGWRG